MIDSELALRIVADPDVLGGKPRIRGTRISVELILAWLAQGGTTEALLKHFPQLKDGDIRACLAFAHFIVAETTLPKVGREETGDDE